MTDINKEIHDLADTLELLNNYLYKQQKDMVGLLLLDRATEQLTPILDRFKVNGKQEKLNKAYQECVTVLQHVNIYRETTNWIIIEHLLQDLKTIVN